MECSYILNGNQGALAITAHPMHTNLAHGHFYRPLEWREMDFVLVRSNYLIQSDLMFT